ncbi:ABC transporter ATP-binding protein [Marispirochaeta sp.]|jgi:iron complex transport system ATP-binding protein|uniref:ABC transporter ATP-binding protein n=1 Tax=Marispirochaeta sp. TaxID=2038653 RepID=UPI0029C66C00|nr:ABC transporter ATP-binding protein [Marispirochaeta sp.]
MIEARDISFGYSGGGKIFRNHSFRLEKGKSMAILGPNGRGKTTLLKCLLGLFPVGGGEIIRNGECGYVPQKASVVFSYSVLDMVVMGRARHIPLFSSPGAADYHIAESLLDTLGITRFRDRDFSSLSGGEQQLVLIARALASECSLLVLDEPTSALDFKNQGRILNTIRDLSGNEGLSIIFTTHSPDHAAFAADDVLLMYSPDEYLFGPADDTMNDDNLRRLYGLEIRGVEYTHSRGRGRALIPVY